MGIIQPRAERQQNRPQQLNLNPACQKVAQAQAKVQLPVEFQSQQAQQRDISGGPTIRLSQDEFFRMTGSS